MTAVFFWYAWVLAVIAFFFIENQALRYRLLMLIAICMCTYSIPSLNDSGLFYLHIGLLVFLGIYFWIQRKRRFFVHFWPFVLCIGYASIQMFLLINPVWEIFPGASLGFIVLLVFLRQIISDIEGMIGIWVLINAGGSLISYWIFSIYINHGTIESQSMLLLIHKGILVLFVFYGIQNLKNKIRKKRRKSTSKGAAFV